MLYMSFSSTCVKGDFLKNQSKMTLTWRSLRITSLLGVESNDHTDQRPFNENTKLLNNCDISSHINPYSIQSPPAPSG